MGCFISGFFTFYILLQRFKTMLWHGKDVYIIIIFQWTFMMFYNISRTSGRPYMHPHISQIEQRYATTRSAAQHWCVICVAVYIYITTFRPTRNRKSREYLRRLTWSTVRVIGFTQFYLLYNSTTLLLYT